MLVSQDLDLSMTLYLQFNLRFGCHDNVFPDHHSVIVQFSNNGGILWQFLNELHSTDTTKSKWVRYTYMCLMCFGIEN